MDWGSSRPDVTQCFPLICCSRAVRPCSPSSSGCADDRRRRAYQEAPVFPRFTNGDARTRDGNYDHVADRKADEVASSSILSIHSDDYSTRIGYSLP
ncbi:hypothetical protein EAG_14207 [Camponotus floridanus]|uniref:Uncharacterized protein n=1 Tax=Camponotus floridanus TaxID=104421 RepID=E1ZX24_CAMFO|nr:hypothetical protein EAG_14207 [Camponotus floridanus]